MSWIAKNYEKAALGGVAVAALGLTFLGWKKVDSVKDDFGAPLTGKGGSQVAVAGADLIPKALQSMKLDRTWAQAQVGDRPVDLFTGIPLFIKRTEPGKPIDLLDKGAPVHPPIPNTWWIDHRIDPGFGDSPQRDPDADGFTNLEEFEAKTDPNNSKSVPALIGKLKFVKDESLAWGLRPGYESDGAFPFNYLDAKGQKNKTSVETPAKPGDLFFEKPPMANRFKLLGHEVRKEMNKKINLEEERTYVRIEDQKPNKKGKVYEIPAPLSDERLNEYLNHDRSAVFSLEALGKSGVEFKVEENTAFSLAPNSTKQDYLLKQVTPDSVIVEYPAADGSRKTVEIPKGGMPKLAD